MNERRCIECFEPVEDESQSLCYNCAEGVFPLEQFESDDEENDGFDFWDFTADL